MRLAPRAKILLAQFPSLLDPQRIVDDISQVMIEATQPYQRLVEMGLAISPRSGTDELWRISDSFAESRANSETAVPVTNFWIGSGRMESRCAEQVLQRRSMPLFDPGREETHRPTAKPF